MPSVDPAGLARGLHDAGAPWTVTVLVLVILVLAALLVLVLRRPAPKVIGEDLLMQLGQQQGAFFERIQAEARDAHRKADKAERKAAAAEETAAALTAKHEACLEAHRDCTHRVEEVERQLADALKLPAIGSIG
jgi:hypothetical protein